MELPFIEELTAGLGQSRCSKVLGLPCHQSYLSVAGSALEAYNLLLPRHALRIVAA